MKCKEFSTLEGCSECKCKLDNTNYIPLLDSYSIIDILDIIIQECNFPPNTNVLLNKSTIDCTGNISIVYDTNVIGTRTSSTKYVYQRLASNWLKGNLLTVQSSMNIMYLILCTSILNYDESDQQALKLISSLQVLFIYISNYIKILQKK